MTVLANCSGSFLFVTAVLALTVLTVIVGCHLFLSRQAFFRES